MHSDVPSVLAAWLRNCRRGPLLTGLSALPQWDFRLAVTGDPGFAHAWISLAATLATQSRGSEAQEALNHALRLEPHNAEALEMKKELTASQHPR